MQFQIRINCGAEVYFIGHEKGDHFRINPPSDTGRWKVSLLELEARMSELLASRNFGGVVARYIFRFEIADFEKWGEWFARDGNRVTYRPKSKSIESVGQLKWADVKDLEVEEQYAALKLAVVRSIENIAAAKRRPKGFNTESFKDAVMECLGQISAKDVRAASAA